MSKIIIVHDCAECPYRERRAVPHTSITYCGKDKYIRDYGVLNKDVSTKKDPLDILDVTTIPDWCTLEDKYF